ncbi:MAG: ABC transporter ATP-binding protein [Planctomycetes bacterium]|nr:ABC transporter ATP-binding protein [Planctomycetota bacterium]
MEDGRELAVSLRGVTKGFGEGSARNLVLRGVDLDVYYGELLLLVGPSGSGKTTLMTILGGMLDADEGQLAIFGSPIERMKEWQKTEFRRNNLGFVFQQFNLIPTLSVVENAAVPLLIKGERRKKALGQASELLDTIGLGKQLTMHPTRLSGGQQQRVAIARALLADPKLLICDEPTASLDGETGKQIMELLRSRAMSRERCVIVVTHDNRIFSYGDRIARILDGRIAGIEEKKPERASATPDKQSGDGGSSPPVHKE